MAKILDGFDGYEPGEIHFVVELLAAMTPIEQIQERFFNFTENRKTISQKTITKISLRFAKQIREQNEAYLKNIKGNPLAHQRVRLDLLDRIIQECLTPRPSHSIRVGEDFEVVNKADYSTAINALKLAMTDLNNREKLDMDKKRDNINLDDEDDNSGNEFDVDDGVA